MVLVSQLPRGSVISGPGGHLWRTGPHVSSFLTIGCFSSAVCGGVQQRRRDWRCSLIANSCLRGEVAPEAVIFECVQVQGCPMPADVPQRIAKAKLEKTSVGVRRKKKRAGFLWRAQHSQTRRAGCSGSHVRRRLALLLPALR